MAGVVTFLVLFISSFVSVEAACFYFDGTITSSDVPCLDGTDPSFCCSFGYACLSNGLCMATDQTPNATAPFVRGSCTDYSWRDKNCPNFCLNQNEPNYDNISGDQGMDLCDGSNWAWYCLDNNEDAVSCVNLTNIALQSEDAPYILTTIGFDDSTTSSAPSSTSSSTSSSPSGNSSSETSSSSSQNTQTSAPTGTVAHFKSVTETVTFATISHTTSPSVSAASASSKTSVKSKSQATIIGVSVGVGLAVIAALVVAFLLYKRRQKKGNSLVQRSDAPPEYYFNAETKTNVDHPTEVPTEPTELESSRCYELENSMIPEDEHAETTSHTPPVKYA